MNNDTKHLRSYLFQVYCSVMPHLSLFLLDMVSIQQGSRSLWLITNKSLDQIDIL